MYRTPVETAKKYLFEYKTQGFIGLKMDMH